MSINKCVCINLYERNDRFMDVQKVFAKYNIPVEFYRTNKDKNGKKGAFTSHVNVIKQAYLDNLDNVLIFEDDLFCGLEKKEFDEKIGLVLNFIGKNSYDIFFLGSQPSIWTNAVKKVSPNIYKVCAICAHAYIVSRSGMEKYKDLTFMETPIDQIYRKSENSFAIYPSIFYQNDCPSDISPDWLKPFDNKKLLGKITENYAMHVNMPINTLLKIFVVLFIILFLVTKKLIFFILIVLYICYTFTF